MKRKSVFIRFFLSLQKCIRTTCSFDSVQAIASCYNVKLVTKIRSGRDEVACSLKKGGESHKTMPKITQCNNIVIYNLIHCRISVTN